MVQRGPSPSVLEVHLLGPFRVVVDGRSVDGNRWARRKPALLIKLLALQPHHQLHREQVIDLLWPEIELESSSNNLHKAIHMARRALEPDLRSAAASHFILTRGQQIIIAAPGRLWVDAEEFERQATTSLKASQAAACEEALTLYKGDLLIEDPYEDWAAPRREQLRTLYQDLLLHAARLYEWQGLHQRSIEWLKKVAALDRANEDAHRRLMRLYALVGNRQQAIAQYEQCAQVLRREFDAEPERTTVALREQILSGEIKALSDTIDVRPLPPDQLTNSIAVLPFLNKADDPNMEYLSDGITENIINTLSQLSTLRVMARDTVFRYKGKDLRAGLVGRDLDVRVVLTGRVTEISGRLMIGVELINVADGSQIWGERYERRPSDIIGLQEEITREICRNLQLKLSNEETERLGKRQTADAEAYRSYLRGRYVLNRLSAEETKRAIEFFKAAIKLDPGYAAAYAGLADALCMRANYREAPLIENYKRAQSWATKAVELDAQLAEAHNSLAAVKLRYEWDLAGAEREFQRAIELNTNYATARLWYSSCFVITGRFDRAVYEANRALELDPVSLSVNLGVALVYHHSGRYREAVEQTQKALELDPNFFPAHALLGIIYAEIGEFEAAIREGLQAIALHRRNSELVASLAYIHGLAGKSSEALQLLEEFLQLSKSNPISRSFDRAMIHIGLGDNDQAFEWLDKAYAERDVALLFLQVALMFNKLRSDPRYPDLVRRVGIPQLPPSKARIDH